ncbi:MAG TPA: ACP S-malonyltransferase, partial [Myxococcota bacterium]|nr:ACP S-malonyltransferase [Myxococcota bacterium]
SLFESTMGQELMSQAENLLKLPLRHLMLEGRKEALTNTAIAQPAILLHSYVAYRSFLEKQSFNISSVLGHSLGEYSALVIAGVVDFADALCAVHTRGKLMQEAVPEGEGAMAAVLGLDADQIIESLAPFSDPNASNYVACANFNGPGQTVIAGTRLGVREATFALKERGAKRVIDLDVSAPFHCALMKPVQEKMAEVLDAISFSDAEVPVISNVSAEPETNGARIKELLLKQIASPVRFSECVSNLIAKKLAGSLFIELGPKNTLAGLVRKIDATTAVFNIDSASDLAKFDQSRIEQ